MILQIFAAWHNAIISPVTFAELPIGKAFRLVPRPHGWSGGKMVKLEKMPGWAMPEGWDFVLADDPEAQAFTVEVLDEPPQLPMGLPSLGEG